MIQQKCVCLALKFYTCVYVHVYQCLCVHVWCLGLMWGVCRCVGCVNSFARSSTILCRSCYTKATLFSSVLVVNNTMFKGSFFDSQLCRVETFPCNTENVYSALYPDNWLCPGESECVWCVLMCWCIFFNAFTVY